MTRFALILTLLAGAALGDTVTIPSQTVTVTIPGGTYNVITGIANGSTITTIGNSTPFKSPVYYAGAFSWPGDYSFGGTVNYKDTAGKPESGAADIAFTLNTAWGAWQPYSQGYIFPLAGYAYLQFDLKPTKAGQTWSLQAMKTGDVDNKTCADAKVVLNVANYGPVPAVGVWGTYKVPIAAIFSDCVNGVMTPMATLYKFSIQDQTGSASNLWYVDNVGFL